MTPTTSYRSHPEIETAASAAIVVRDIARLVGCEDTASRDVAGFYRRKGKSFCYRAPRIAAEAFPRAGSVSQRLMDRSVRTSRGDRVGGCRGRYCAARFGERDETLFAAAKPLSDRYPRCEAKDDRAAAGCDHVGMRGGDRKRCSS